MAYKCYQFLCVPVSEKVWEALLVLVFKFTAHAFLQALKLLFCLPENSFVFPNSALAT